MRWAHLRTYLPRTSLLPSGLPRAIYQAVQENQSMIPGTLWGHVAIDAIRDIESVPLSSPENAVAAGRRFCRWLRRWHPGLTSVTLNFRLFTDVHANKLVGFLRRVDEAVWVRETLYVARRLSLHRC